MSRIWCLKQHPSNTSIFVVLLKIKNKCYECTLCNSVKHVGAQKKSRIIGEVGSEGGRIWRDYCILILAHQWPLNMLILYKTTSCVGLLDNISWPDKIGCDSRFMITKSVKIIILEPFTYSVHLIST